LEELLPNVSLELQEQWQQEAAAHRGYADELRELLYKTESSAQKISI
jgi:hypothetical protein